MVPRRRAIPTPTFVLPPGFDYAATLIFAVSGASVAARRGYDLVGSFVVALVSSTGGGLLRDGLFLQHGPPALVRNAAYLLIAAGATLGVALAGQRIRRLERFDAFVQFVDAMGLGAYAVVGMSLALASHLSLPGVVLVGVVNAVGGGLLRDVLTQREPDFMKPGVYYALTVLAGCLAFVALRRFTVLGLPTAGWMTAVLVFALRVAALTFNWRTRPLLVEE